MSHALSQHLAEAEQILALADLGIEPSPSEVLLLKHVREQLEAVVDEEERRRQRANQPTPDSDPPC